jgi:hypothetical protein
MDVEGWRNDIDAFGGGWATCAGGAGASHSEDRVCDYFFGVADGRCLEAFAVAEEGLKGYGVGAEDLLFAGHGAEDRGCGCFVDGGGGSVRLYDVGE